MGAAQNVANSLLALKHHKEAKALLRKTIPIARRVLGEGDHLGLSLRLNYGRALFLDPGVTLDDLREAETTLENAKRTARRFLGGAYPLAQKIETVLRCVRDTLAARETPPSDAS